MVNIASKQNTISWISIKILIVIFWAPFMLYILYTRSPLQFPTGIAQYLDIGIFLNGLPRIIITVSILIISLFYLLEIQMLLTTLAAFLISVIIFTIEKSNGFSGENGMLSMLFFAQFFAYFFFATGINLNLHKNRVQFAAQIIVAAYTLSALSKIQNQDFEWVLSGSNNFALEAIRFSYYDYISDNNAIHLQNGMAVASFILNHSWLIKTMLGCTLFLELFAWSMLLNKKIARIYALCLLAMHVGIYFFLGILYPAITIPMVAVFINPIYWISLLYLKYKKHLS